MAYELKMRSDGTHIMLYGDVGTDLTPNKIRESLKNTPPNQTIFFHINSRGGSVYDGVGIYNMIAALPNPTVGILEGLAGSVMSLIMLACKTRQAYDNAYVMVHNPSFQGISGNASELKDAIAHLEQMQTTVEQIYLKHLKVSADQLKEMLSKDTYLSAASAKKMGFITDIVSTPSASVAPGRLVALLKGTAMEFELWLKAQCDELGLDINTVDKEKFKARFATMMAGANPPAQQKPPQPQLGAPAFNWPQAQLPAQPVAQFDPVALQAQITQASIEANRQMMVAENLRMARINGVASGFAASKLNAETLKASGITGSTTADVTAFAIANNWSADQTELVLRRAAIPTVGQFAIHSHSQGSIADNREALQCALLRHAGVSMSGTVNGRKIGVESMFSEKVLNDSERFRDISLLGMLDRIHQEVHGYRYQGRLNTDGFLATMRDTMRTAKLRMDSGNTTTGGLNIFDDVANKALWNAYQAVDTTWQNWVAQRPVNDFKSHAIYRLTHEGTYQKVGGDGKLQTGGFADTKITHSADTYGKIVGLNRTILINDDLGALNGVMASLGEEGAHFLEELFYAYLLDNLTTIFSSGNGNTTTGALTVDGLSGVEQVMGDMVTSDKAPILNRASMVLVGSALAVKADELYAKVNLTVLQTANAKGRPNDNPHVGKFRPVVSGYLNNTNIKRRIATASAVVGAAFSNQSATQYVLLRAPSASNGGLIIGSFLNGRTTPFIESADAAFDVLGMQWRAYHDAGADQGDPKWGVYSTGV